MYLKSNLRILCSRKITYQFYEGKCLLRKLQHHKELHKKLKTVPNPKPNLSTLSKIILKSSFPSLPRPFVPETNRDRRLRLFPSEALFANRISALPRPWARAYVPENGYRRDGSLCFRICRGVAGHVLVRFYYLRFAGVRISGRKHISPKNGDNGCI